MYLSSSLTLEELAAAKHFFRQICHIPHITSSALDHKLVSFLSLFATNPTSFKKLDNADMLVAFMLNGNHRYAPLTLAIKRAAERGIPYLQIGWIKDTTTRFATFFQTPPSGREARFFEEILNHLETGKSVLGEASKFAAALKASHSPLFILGADILHLTAADYIMQVISRIVTACRAQVFTVLPYGNISGLLSLEFVKPQEEVRQLIDRGEIDILYLIGDNPFDKRPPVKSIIYQNVFLPEESLGADIILPGAAFGESPGSFYREGFRKKFSSSISPPGAALPHEVIFSRILESMNEDHPRLDLSMVSRSIPEEAPMALLPPKPFRASAVKDRRAKKEFAFILVEEKRPHQYHDVNLNRIIPGMKVITHEDTIVISLDDADRLDIHEGDVVLVKSADTSREFPAAIRRNIPPGIVYLNSSTRDFTFTTNPLPVTILPLAKKRKSPPRRRDNG